MAKKALVKIFKNQFFGIGSRWSPYVGHPKARYSARHSNFWDGHLVQP